MRARQFEKYKSLGLNIAYYRKAKGLSQSELAEKIDISRTHMSRIETAEAQCRWTWCLTSATRWRSSPPDSSISGIKYAKAGCFTVKQPALSISIFILFCKICDSKVFPSF